MAEKGILSFFKRCNEATGNGSGSVSVEEVNAQRNNDAIVITETITETTLLDVNAQPQCENGIKKKRKRVSDQWILGREFQPEWARKFPFIKLVTENEEYGTTKRPTRMRCLACSWKNKHDCIFQLKLDTVKKHAGKIYEKIIVDGKEMKTARWKTKEECRHLQAVADYQVYLAKQELPIVSPIKCMMQQMADKNLRSKIVQLQALFHVLKQGKPLSDFPAHEDLLSLQPIPDFPSTHCSIQSGEEFARSIDQVLIDDLREQMENCDYFAMSLDEASAKDNSSWLCMSVYIVEILRSPKSLAQLQSYGYG